MPKLLVLVLMFFSLTASADHAAEGYAAYQRGDYSGAMNEWRTLAEQGDATIQNNLGALYEHGHGVAKNYTQAAHWYRKGAEQGDATAQSNLGLMYSKGHGVAQDYAEAFQWFRKSAEQGDAAARYSLGLMYSKGQGVAQDYAEAFRWFRKSAEQGDASAQYNLGWIYANGQGVAINYERSVYWHALAAQNGNTLAADNIESNLPYLPKLVVNKDDVNIREKASASSKVLLTASKDTALFSLSKQNGWLEVYARTGNTLGYVADYVVTEYKPSAASE